MKKKVKEFKQLEAKDIIERIDNFLDTQKLESESKYFIVKHLVDRYWEEIRMDDQEAFNDFYEEEEFEDDDYENDDFDIKTDKNDLEPSNNEQTDDDFPEDDEELDLPEEITKEMNYEEELTDNVEDLLKDVDEEKTAKDIKEKQKKNIKKD